MRLSRRTTLLSGLAALGVAPAAAQGQPSELRLGVGAAAEETLWMLEARPDLAPNQGRIYRLNITRFPGTDRRFQAYEAGALDLLTGSSHAVSMAAAEGSDFRVVASLSRESAQGFSQQYFVLENSPVRRVQDLRGRTLGTNGIGSSTHLWAKIVLERAGLDPERDVTFLPVRFPAMGEALRAGRIDVGTFPQPFAQAEEDRGGLRSLFTSKDAAPFDEELMLLLASPRLLSERPAVARAFLSDLVRVTRFYIEQPEEARRALVNARIVRMPVADFIRMRDYYREPNARPDPAALERSQELLLRGGFQRNRVDFSRIVDTSFLPAS